MYVYMYIYIYVYSLILFMSVGLAFYCMFRCRSCKLALDRAGYSRDLCALAEVEIGVMKDFKDIIVK